MAGPLIVVPGCSRHVGRRAFRGDQCAAESFLLVGTRRSERRLRRFDSCLRNLLHGE